MEINENIFDIAKNVILKRKVQYETYMTKESEDNYINNYIVPLSNGVPIEDLMESYEEMNDHYRTIAGLPPFGDSGVLYNGSYISRDFNKPNNISEKELRFLISRGELNKVIEENPNYSYLRYLEFYANPIIARSTKDYDPIVVKSGDSPLSNLFYDILFQKVKYFRRWVINDYMTKTYSYYEPMICIMIILSTCSEVLSRTSNVMINTNIITENDFYNIFKSYDLPFWDLPNSIRERFVDNMQLIIQSASSKRVVALLTSVFGTANVYKYLMYKASVNNLVTIRFVRTPHDEKNYENYLSNELHIFPYEDIVKQDELWSINDDIIYEELLETPFTILNSKYMSVENMVDLTKALSELNYFMNFFFANESFSKSATIIYEGTTVSVFEFLTYVMSMICLINGYDDFIPYMVLDYAYVEGINTKVDYATLENFINDYNDNVKMYNGREEDLIVTSYEEFKKLTLSTSETMGDAINRYDGANNFIKFIRGKMKDAYDSEYLLLEKILESITKSNMLKEIFEGEMYYSKYLEKKNSPLFWRYYDLQYKEKSFINEEVENIIYKLEELSSGKGFLNNMFEGVKSKSQELIRAILYEALKIFKSHTVDLLPMKTNYILPEDTVKIVDSLNRYITLFIFDKDGYYNILDDFVDYKRYVNNDTVSLNEEIIKMEV